MTFATRRRTPPEINLIPLIDILFIVLTFLVLTTSFKGATVLQLTLPEAGTAERMTADTPGLIQIFIDLDDELYLGEQRLDSAELQRRLSVVDGKADATVLLTADTSASHGRVIEVMDAVRRAGIFRITVETRRDSRP